MELQGGEDCRETHLSIMLKLIVARDQIWPMLGFSFAWLGYFLSHLEFLKLIFQVAAAFFGASTGAVAFGLTLWKWRNIVKLKSKHQKS